MLIGSAITRFVVIPIAYSNGVMHSAELWGGVSFRHQGVALFDTVRISPGFVFGLSAISNPIGQEGLHQIDHHGSANVLFYLGFDLAFALAYPSQHRIGFPHPAPLRCIRHARWHEGGEQRKCNRDTATFLIGVIVPDKPLCSLCQTWRLCGYPRELSRHLASVNRPLTKPAHRHLRLGVRLVSIRFRRWKRALIGRC